MQAVLSVIVSVMLLLFIGSGIFLYMQIAQNQHASCNYYYDVSTTPLPTNETLRGVEITIDSRVIYNKLSCHPALTRISPGLYSLVYKYHLTIPPGA